MNANRDIILLFSEKDNRTIEKDTKGWVSNFNKFLHTLLFQIMRRSPRITPMDEASFNVEKVSEAAALIVVVTPNLANSPDMVQTLNDLCEKYKSNDLLVLDGICRVFKVHKLPFEDEEYLPALNEFIAYDFFMTDPLSGEAIEFRRFFNANAERSYWMKLVDMAYDIRQILNAVKKPDFEPESRTWEQFPREKTVYLASTGVDVVIQRDVIRRELIRHGYRVLPNHTLPKEARLLEMSVREDLAKCRLSIHLVGEDYGYKPKGSDLSVVDIQNRVAGKHSYEMAESQTEQEPFSRLIWISPNLSRVSERQKIFIEDLKSDVAALEKAEVLQVTLQELKGIIREELVTANKINTRGDAVNQYAAVEDDSPIIYLISDKQDVKPSQQIEGLLKSRGYRVVSPAYEGDPIDIRYIHQENLKKCDASIIYFGEANEEWIKTKLQDLLKAPGLGRNKPLKAKAVYLDGKKDVDFQTYKRNGALILGNNAGFKPEHLNPFLKRLK